MTRDDHIAFCRKCNHRKFDQHQGFICRLTDKKADFQDTCPDFQVDHLVKDKVQPYPDEEILKLGLEVIGDLSGHAKDKLRQYQDFRAALIGGMLAALISSLLWAVIDVGFNVPLFIQILTKGLMIGLSVRYFGAGIDLKFGILGAALALASCALGIVFTEIGLAAREYNVGFLEALNNFDYTQLLTVLDEVVTPIDYLFFVIGTYEAYRLAFRAFSSKELAKIDLPNFDPIPPGYSYKKLSTLVASVMLLGIVYLFNLPKPTIPDHDDYEYEDFIVMERYPDDSQKAQGAYFDKYRQDVWTFWYPNNGGIEAVGFFKNSIPYSEWIWYSKSGSVLREGYYHSGLKSNLWTSYYQNGRIKDSCQFIKGREQGKMMKYYDSGELLQTSVFKNGLENGSQITYHKNGQVKSEGFMKNGERSGIWKRWQKDARPLSEVRYESEQASIINAWDSSGHQSVKAGVGYLKEYYETGERRQEGRIRNGRRTGIWKSYYTNQSLMEEGEYVNNVYVLSNAWLPSGELCVRTGNGEYKRYNSAGEFITESGKITNGLKEGTWNTYEKNSEQPISISTYKGGVLEGQQRFYYKSGAVMTEGKFSAGKKTGDWVKYFEGGERKSTVFFENGSKTGTQTIWHSDGRKIIEETYLKGQLIKGALFIRN